MALLIVSLSIALAAVLIAVWVILPLPQQHHARSVSAWYRKDGR